MPIILDGSSLTIEKVVAIARHHEKIELAPEALERIKVCRLMLEEKLGQQRGHVRHEHGHWRVFRDDAQRRAGQGVSEISDL